MPAEVCFKGREFLLLPSPSLFLSKGQGGVLFVLRASGVCMLGLCSHLSQVLLALAESLRRVSGGQEGQLSPVARGPFPQNDRGPLFYSMLISNNKWVT